MTDKEKHPFYQQDMMPDWRDSEPVNKPDVGLGALTANDIDDIDIDRLYEEQKRVSEEPYIFEEERR